LSDRVLNAFAWFKHAAANGPRTEPKELCEQSKVFTRIRSIVSIRVQYHCTILPGQEFRQWYFRKQQPYATWPRQARKLRI
jgi:hypothetical protein